MNDLDYLKAIRATILEYGYGWGNVAFFSPEEHGACLLGAAAIVNGITLPGQYERGGACAGYTLVIDDALRLTRLLALPPAPRPGVFSAYPVFRYSDSFSKDPSRLIGKLDEVIADMEANVLEAVPA